MGLDYKDVSKTEFELRNTPSVPYKSAYKLWSKSTFLISDQLIMIKYQDI
jgi:hypothetical protein